MHCVVEALFAFGYALLQFTHAFTYPAHESWNLRPAKKEQDDEQDDDPLAACWQS